LPVCFRCSCHKTTLALARKKKAKEKQKKPNKNTNHKTGRGRVSPAAQLSNCRATAMISEHQKIF